MSHHIINLNEARYEWSDDFVTNQCIAHTYTSSYNLTISKKSFVYSVAQMMLFPYTTTRIVGNVILVINKKNEWNVSHAVFENYALIK